MLKNFILTHGNVIEQFPEPATPWKYSQNNIELELITRARINQDFNAIVDEIPDTLMRDNIASFFNVIDLSKKEKRQNLYKGFIATILWGGKHKSRPPGKDHFLKIVAMDKNTIMDRMENVYNILLEGVEDEKVAKIKIREAYLSLNNVENNGIPGVKDSYFTKILYFMGKSINSPIMPLIHDRHMKMAHCDILLDDGEQSLGFYGWSEKYGLRAKKYADSYIDYCQRMNKYAESIQVAPDILECSIFNLLHPGAPTSPVYQSVYNRRHLL